MATPKQIAIITELKSQLAAESYSLVKEWAYDRAVTPTEDVNIYILGTGDTANGTRTSVEEVSYFTVFICIAKSAVVSDGIELIKQTNLEKVKRAIFDTLDASSEELVSSEVHGDSQEISLTEFNNENYFSYSVNFNITVDNSY